MKKIITLMLATVMLATTLAACTEAPTSSSQSVESNTSTSTPDDSTATGNTMSFYNGEMELPTEFGNFVVLDFTLVDQFVALDVPPKYGSTAVPAESGYYDDWVRAFEGFDLNSITYVSTKTETYMEELISYKPDFIVIPESAERELGKYQEIAPTYVFPEITEAPEGSAIWKEELKFVGEFVGKADVANELIASYDQLVEESRAAVVSEIEGKTALVLQLNEKGFKIRMPETQASVYTDMGFAVPEGLDSSFASTSVSNEDGSFPVETIVTFNPDYIFVQNQSADSYNALVGTPIWENISAVKDGRVYEITQSAWNHLNGYHANTLRIKDLTYFILEDKQVNQYTPIAD